MVQEEYEGQVKDETGDTDVEQTDIEYTAVVGSYLLYYFKQDMQFIINTIAGIAVVIGILAPVTAVVTGSIAVVCGNVSALLGILDLALYSQQVYYGS